MVSDIKVSGRQIAAGAVLLGLGAAVLMHMISTMSDAQHINALWLVGLLVIAMAALTFTAMVYSGLGLGNAGEAFGLPAGSVRTLLAIGIMVLVVVFGLSFFRPVPQLPDAGLHIDVPGATLDKDLAAYRAAGLVAVVITPAVAGGANAAAPAAAPAKVLLLRSKAPPEMLDLEKQVLTAILTLLTTVIGFYFGSKTAADGQRDKTDVSGAALPGGSDSAAVDSDYNRLTAQGKALLTRLDELGKAAVLPNPPNTLAAPLAKALALRDPLAQAQASATAAMAALRARKDALATTGADAAAKAAADTALKLAVEAARQAILGLKQATDTLSESIAAAELQARKP